MGETPRFALPYPELDDPADVPTDMEELATAVEAIPPLGYFSPDGVLTLPPGGHLIQRGLGVVCGPSDDSWATLGAVTSVTADDSLLFWLDYGRTVKATLTAVVSNGNGGATPFYVPAVNSLETTGVTAYVWDTRGAGGFVPAGTSLRLAWLAVVTLL